MPGGFFDDGGGAGVSFSDGESIQFVGKPLLSADETMELLSDWQDGGWRYGIVQLRGARAVKVALVPFDQSVACRARLGAHRPVERGHHA